MPNEITAQCDVEKHGGLEANKPDDVFAKTGSDLSPDTTNAPSSLDSSSDREIPPTPVVLKGRIGRWNDRIESLAGLEARGIKRVLPEEKRDVSIRGYVQMFLLWFGINLVVLNIITGLLGPLVFALGWKDCVCIVIFANMLSCCGPAYTSTFGPQSGNRTMVRLPKHRSLMRQRSSSSFLQLSWQVEEADICDRSLGDTLWAIGPLSWLASSISSCKLAGVLLDVSWQAK